MSKYPLRHRQPQMVSEVLQHWGEGRKRVIMQCPTSGGKTIMFNHITNICEKKGHRVLIICDRVGLIELTPETMEFYRNAKKFDTIHKRQQASGYKPLWAYFQYAQKYPEAMGLQELQYIGTKLGFKPGWGYFKHKELQEKAKQ